MAAIVEPYSDIFDAILTNLSAAGGPFTENEQVQLYPPDGIDDVAPTEHLMTALTPSTASPKCLVSYDGGVPGDQIGDALHAEEFTVLVRYAVRHPSSWALAYKGDGQAGGDRYWGLFAVQKWILAQLLDDSVQTAGTMRGLRLGSITTIPLRQPYTLACAMRLQTDVSHQDGVIT